jgi:hypothetical protein
MAFPSSRESLGVIAARRALRGAKAKPTERDRPPPSTLPGRRGRVLPGQLDLAGREHK